MVLLFHVDVINLYVFSIQIRNPQIWVKLDTLDLVFRGQGSEPSVIGLELFEYLIADENFEAEDFLFLELGLVRSIGE